ncbi:hypothetical protein BP1258A_5007 [Burkholderia pseudomallei 1258a]|uniref:Uncharacterized protein n=3 Tax=Burkholderia pseudomallei TaxID=28450 RepID=A0A0H3HIH6_BURP2|nr:hypothetical protein BP1026B_I1067 [Burkholderia pseudomallei 1026b]ARK50338.1 hypothetical protein BOC35_30425 [Burkholderia pseudomallei]EEH25085.1 hypothetical protein BUH_2676 [Burkholderia pseudomallei Pakistan 9]EET07250.1 hypothetical protein BURPS1710A_3127 [Burkholderia pseudomallei 1710a]EIF53518.1 hypothetical protein BP1258B_5839 [Burkholderia pseudomallei 1258b]EIF54712.1 hypothetical protein BP1258A_5007 [Burkholderia pseudomallei 1258a]EIF66787.1 hypothetical protein BP1026A
MSVAPIRGAARRRGGERAGADGARPPREAAGESRARRKGAKEGRTRGRAVSAVSAGRRPAWRICALQ